MCVYVCMRKSFQSQSEEEILKVILRIQARIFFFIQKFREFDHEKKLLSFSHRHTKVKYSEGLLRFLKLLESTSFVYNEMERKISYLYILIIFFLLLHSCFPPISLLFFSLSLSWHSFISQGGGGGERGLIIKEVIFLVKLNLEMPSSSDTWILLRDKLDK